MLSRLLLLCVFSLMALQGAVPVVLDTDIGDDIDDALALALVLQSPELDLRAITTVLQGGEARGALVWRILELYDRTSIPVGLGAEQTLLGNPSSEVPIQAKALPAGFRMPEDRRRNGVQLMIDTVMRSPEKITLLAVGPLTNVALALRAEPRLKDKLERIVLMNGVFFQSGLEYNTYRDAEASAIVYSSGVPVMTVGLDVTLQCRLSPAQLERIGQSNLPNVKFLYQLIQAWQNGKANQMPILHDPLAVLAMIQPDLVTLQKGKVEVETRGVPGRSQGLSVLRKDANGPVQVAQTVKAQDAIELFLRRVAATPRSGTK